MLERWSYNRPWIIICRVVSDTDFIGDGYLLNRDLSDVLVLFKHSRQSGGRIDIHVLIHIKEEGPICQKPRPKQAVIHNQKLVMIVTIINLLLLNVLNCHTTLLNPWLQNPPHIVVKASWVVKEEMGSIPKEICMICHPLPHPLRANITIDWWPTVDIVIRKGRVEESCIVLIFHFRKNNYPLRFSVLVTITCIQDKITSRFVSPDSLLELAREDNNCIQPSIVPVWKNLVNLTLDNNGWCCFRASSSSSSSSWDPLTSVWRMMKDVNGFWCQSHNWETSGTASIGSHLNEKMSCHAMWLEDTHFSMAQIYGRAVDPLMQERHRQRVRVGVVRSCGCCSCSCCCL